MRFLLYSHDGQGLGHVRRNLVLAEALTANGSGDSVLIATGADEIDSFAIPPSVDVVKLPGLQKVTNDRYRPRRLPDSPDAVRRLRRELLTTMVGSFRPDVLVADKHPAGLDGELTGALELLAARGGSAVLGLRDVLDDPRAVRREWCGRGLWRCVSTHHSMVLVYGRRELFDPLDRSGCPDSVRRRARFCGYVVRDTSIEGDRPDDLPPRRPGRPLVLATVGGGADGAELLRAFVATSASRGWDGIAVTGPQAPSGEHEAIAARGAASDLEVRRLVPDLTRWLPHVDALVAMGGYNTLLESLAVGTPVVCVPRTVPRREQTIRAQMFARHGLLHCLPADGLTSAALEDAVTRALAGSRRALRSSARRVLGLDGADRAAELLLSAGTAGSRHTERIATP